MARCKYSTSTAKKGIVIKQKLRKAKLSLPSPIVRSKKLSEKITPKRIEDRERNHTSSNIPFSPDEQILLVGEADLSFTCSLIEHHGCNRVTATVYESEAELRVKYPHVDHNIRLIETSNQSKILYGFDVTKAKSWSGWLGKHRKSGIAGSLDRIIFNFPHVGGKSKDVNRQIRYNQELLVSFFRNALPWLSSAYGSSIIVTLFDGEPYTLWNIRDLARHSCLEVAQSFKFRFNVYPGYRHSRTLGIVKSKCGKDGGGWRGEEKSARTFVLVRKGEGQATGLKIKKNQRSSEEEDEQM